MGQDRGFGRLGIKAQIGQIPGIGHAGSGTATFKSCALEPGHAVDVKKPRKWLL